MLYSVSLIIIGKQELEELLVGMPMETNKFVGNLTKKKSTLIELLKTFTITNGQIPQLQLNN